MLCCILMKSSKLMGQDNDEFIFMEGRPKGKRTIPHSCGGVDIPEINIHVRRSKIKGTEIIRRSIEVLARLYISFFWVYFPVVSKFQTSKLVTNKFFLCFFRRKRKGCLFLKL